VEGAFGAELEETGTIGRYIREVGFDEIDSPGEILQALEGIAGPNDGMHLVPPFEQQPSQM
jgi:hypothetical protein